VPAFHWFVDNVNEEYDTEDEEDNSSPNLITTVNKVVRGETQ
jgi:hypothetical protein